MTLNGAEGASPPLPYIEVADAEAKALLQLYPRNIVVVGEVAASVMQLQLAIVAAPAEPAPVVVPDAVAQSTPDRATEISDAIDLLEGDKIVKTGPRAGKPTVEAIAEILGGPVTAEEIDAAVAAKEVE